MFYPYCLGVLGEEKKLDKKKCQFQMNYLKNATHVQSQ
jgi:hypothetical protein